MHHNNHDSKKMRWMMAGCLLLPLAIILFFSGSLSQFRGWALPAAVILFMGAHIAMFFGHSKSHEPETANDSKSFSKHE